MAMVASEGTSAWLGGRLAGVQGCAASGKKGGRGDWWRRRWMAGLQAGGDAYLSVSSGHLSAE
jgi:hypothetical protein